MKRASCLTRLPLVLAAVVGLASPARAAVNLLSNPGFEDGGGSYTGWPILFGSGPNISTPGTDNIIRSGSAAAKIFGEFTGCPIPNFDTGGFGQSFTPVAGQVYTFSGYSLVSSTDPMTGANVCASNRCIAKISFFSAPVGGLLLSANEIVVGAESTPQDTWVPFSISAPAPATAMRVEALVIFLQPGCATGSVFLDDLTFCQSAPPTPLANSLANPSFSSGLAGWTPFGNVVAETRGFGIRSATGSAKMFGPFSTPGAASGMFQGFPTAPGLDWQLGAWAMHTCQESPLGPGNLNFATAKIVFRDGGGTEIAAAEATIADANSPLGTWRETTVAATAPAGTATVEAYLLFIQPDSTQGGAVWVDDALLRQAVLVGAPDVAESAPGFDLRQNVPNPFGAATRIEFVLTRSAPVELAVYDVGGRLVRTLVDRPMTAGTHAASWDGRTADGLAAAAGVYRCVLRTPEGRISRSMMLLK
jgi:hypothetical protein